MAIVINNFDQSKVPQLKYEPDKPLYTSALGTPVYSDLHIKGGSYINNAGNKVFYEDLIVETVLFNVNQTKNIVRTVIVGSDNGSVKEYIGKGDYVINCSMIISSGQIKVHPWDKADALNDIFNAPVALDIVSEYLNRKGIYQIVITDYDIPQLPGEYSQLTISFNALSDEPVILLYNSSGSPIQ